MLQKPNLKDMGPSAYVLILFNLISIYGAIYLDWDIFILLFIFWTENIAIGILTVLKMLIVPGQKEKLFLIPFFCVHYGLFTFGHGMFLLGFFLQKQKLSDLFESHNIAWMIFVLFASHLFSFFYNFIGKQEYKKTHPFLLMFAPYPRIVVMHITILLGGFAAMLLNSPMWALIVLIVLKIILDLGAHTMEHKKFIGPQLKKSNRDYSKTHWRQP